jgi:hypothetical protein
MSERRSMGRLFRRADSGYLMLLSMPRGVKCCAARPHPALSRRERGNMVRPRPREYEQGAGNDMRRFQPPASRPLST